jgi:hypothetical protein
LEWANWSYLATSWQPFGEKEKIPDLPYEIAMIPAGPPPLSSIYNPLPKKEKRKEVVDYYYLAVQRAEMARDHERHQETGLQPEYEATDADDTDADDDDQCT